MAGNPELEQYRTVPCTETTEKKLSRGLIFSRRLATSPALFCGVGMAKGGGGEGLRGGIRVLGHMPGH